MVKQAVRLKVTESGSEPIHDPNTASEVPTSPEQILERFRNTFELNVLERPSKDELVFELIHVDTSFANALRRILLAEIPTMAIEHVYISKNSSLIHDEVLAHRLGLIPIMADARFMDEYIEESTSGRGGGGTTTTTGGLDNDNEEEEEEIEEGGANDRNTLVFRLAVSCTHAEARMASGGGTSSTSSSNTTTRPQKDIEEEDDDDDKAMDMDHLVATGAGLGRSSNNHNHHDQSELEDIAQETASKQPYQFPKDRPYTKHVYSRDLEWIPQGDQKQQFVGNDMIRPIHDDILLAKLRPGQSIELEAHARRGVGKDHAKYSPVCTASYRLMPHVELIHDIYDEDAEELVHIYEPGVFELISTNPTTTTKGDPPGTRQKAIVKNPYACTMSRNYMKHDKLAKAIKITRITDHFIFSIESVGMYRPAVLLAEALRVLQRKCQYVMDLAENASLE